MNISIPLTPAVFYILLSLYTQNRYGYEIMQCVQHDSRGAVLLGAGTLYGALKRMHEEGLIQEIRDTTEISSGRKQRYYMLTARGKSLLMMELSRFENSIQLARKRNIFSIDVHSQV